MPIFVIIALVALLGGGTSVVAERALPGDALYPIKVDVNEKIVAALSLSADAKTKWDERLAERRLEEAETLSAEGKMSADVRVDLEDRFQEHADRVEARIKELRGEDDRDAADIASDFEASLRVHADILGRFASSSASLKEKVDSDLNDVDDLRSESEMKIASEGKGPEVKAAAEGKIGAAENVIASSENFIKNKTEVLGASVTASAEARLKVAEGLAAQAKVKVSAGAYGEAFNLANRAIRVANEAKDLIESGLRIGVDENSTLFEEDENEHENELDNETSTENRENERERNATSGVRVRGEVKVNVEL